MLVRGRTLLYVPSQHSAHRMQGTCPAAVRRAFRCDPENNTLFTCASQQSVGHINRKFFSNNMCVCVNRYLFITKHVRVPAGGMNLSSQ
jgi:hypothetical protein